MAGVNSSRQKTALDKLLAPAISSQAPSSAKKFLNLFSFSATMAPDSANIRYRSKKPFTSASKETAEVLPKRTRNRGVALSIKEVRIVAESLRQSNRNPEAEIGSALEQESPIRKRKPKKMLGSGSPELPKKYEILIQFFNNLVNSIRLSKLKVKIPLFKSLCLQIKTLTERNFTYHHLAQLKYILPEAIELKKVMVRDEETYCEEPNLRISLNPDAIEATKDKNMTLQKIFRSRLLEFIKTHPEGDEVPEEALPEPFHHQLTNNNSKLPSQTSLGNAMQHFPQSFQPRFSRTLMEKNCHVPSKVFVESPSPPVPESNSLATPVKVNSLDNFNSTPAKLASTPVQILAEVRASQTAKRSLDIPNNDSENPLNKLARRPPRGRTLRFSEEDNNEISQKDRTSYNVDVLDVLSESLLQSIREKEQKANEERDPAISLAKRRHKIIRNLPKRFDTIRHLLRSLNRFVMTKQELVQKITHCCLDIVDRKEVEEELEMLIELAPEWITEKSALNGDVIICINKSSNADVIRARLAEAK